MGAKCCANELEKTRYRVELQHGVKSVSVESRSPTTSTSTDEEQTCPVIMKL